METISIVFSFDDNYCTLGAGAIASIIKHANIKYKYDIYIICNGISLNNQVRINLLNTKPNHIDIKFIKYNEKQINIDHVFTDRYINKYALVRLFLYVILPTFLDKIIYIDADAIITSDLVDLYNTDLNEYPIGMCLSRELSNIASIKKRIISTESTFVTYKTMYDYFTKYLKFSNEEIEHYCNSGTLLISLKKAAPIFKAYLPKLIFKKFYFHDQDVLNILFRHNKFILPAKYGITIGSSLRDYIREHSCYPDIIQYAGPLKPTQSMQTIGQNLYWENIEDTNYYFTALEEFVNHKLYISKQTISNNSNNRINLWYKLLHFFNISKDIHLDMLTGLSLHINKKKYYICSPNNRLVNCISIYNPYNHKYLRHINGTIIESPIDNSEIFEHDSSFIPEIKYNKLFLKTSNPTFSNKYIYKDGNLYKISSDNQQKHAFKIKQSSKFSRISFELEWLREKYIALELNKSELAANTNKKFDNIEKYQLITFLSVIRNTSTLKSYTGKLLWNFVDQKRNITAFFGSFYNLELFFYRKFKYIKTITANTDLYIQHGGHISDGYLSIMMHCTSNHIPMIFAEEGLISSIFSANPNNKTRIEYKQQNSLLIDALSCYYDATVPNSLENELNSDLTYDNKEISRAKRLISLILENKISKYNNQTLICDVDIDISKFPYAVVVIDQAYKDWSITKGYVEDNLFTTMLDAAIAENPDALILVKVHPDMVADPYRNSKKNLSKGYFTDYIVNLQDIQRVKFITSYANAYSLLELVQKVYVCTSQFGFEALMAGKEVHIWGSPFYAGWGIGIQRVSSPAIQRRTKKHTIEEIFISAYLHFSRYVDPFTYEVCELESFVKSMIKLRERYYTYQLYVDSNFINFEEPIISEVIPIVFTVENTSYQQTLLAIASLLENEVQNKYSIYCLSLYKINNYVETQITTIAKKYVSLANIEFISLSSNADTLLYNSKNVTGSEILKFKLHQIFPKLDRIVYCAPNVIFLRGISYAWQCSSAFDTYIAACPDLEECKFKDLYQVNTARQKIWKKYFYYSGYPNQRAKYINSNFMIFNLAKIRKDAIDGIWNSYMHCLDDLNSSDILFLVCAPKIYYLSIRYASNIDLFTYPNNYTDLFDNIYAPEEQVLVTQKTVAVRYPIDNPPWHTQLDSNIMNAWDNLFAHHQNIKKLVSEMISA